MLKPEAPDADNVISMFPNPNVSDTQDTVEQWVIWTVIDGKSAPNVYELPKWAQARVFKTWEAFEAAIMWEHPTYDLDLAANGHIG